VEETRLQGRGAVYVEGRPAIYVSLLSYRRFRCSGFPRQNQWQFVHLFVNALPAEKQTESFRKRSFLTDLSGLLAEEEFRVKSGSSLRTRFAICASRLALSM